MTLLNPLLGRGRTSASFCCRYLTSTGTSNQPHHKQARPGRPGAWDLTESQYTNEIKRFQNHVDVTSPRHSLTYTELAGTSVISLIRKKKLDTDEEKQRRIMKKKDAGIPLHYAYNPQRNARRIRKHKAASHQANMASIGPNGPLNPDSSPFASIPHLHPLLLKAFTALGFLSPTCIQSRALPVLLGDKLRADNDNIDYLIASETGSGKTLAYLAPIFNQILNDRSYATESGFPYAIILVPTHELAKQVTQMARQITNYLSEEILIPVVGMYGGQSLSEHHQVDIEANIDILVTIPALLEKKLNTEKLSLRNMRYLVIDEADTLFDTGFREKVEGIVRPQLEKRELGLLARSCLQANSPMSLYDDKLDSPFYLSLVEKMADARNDAKKNQVIKLSNIPGFSTIIATATLTSTFQVLVDKMLKFVTKIESPFLHRSIPTVNYIFVRTRSNDNEKLNAFFELLTRLNAAPPPQQDTPEQDTPEQGTIKKQISKQNYQKTLVFCKDQKSVVFLMHRFKERGIPCQYLFGSMFVKERTLVVSQFNKATGDSQPAILLTTDLASRGLDLAKVNLVLNFDFPPSAADFLHRAGRSARMGSSGTVVSLFTKKQAQLAHSIESELKTKSSFGEALTNDNTRYASEELGDLDHLYSNYGETGELITDLPPHPINQSKH